MQKYEQAVNRHREYVKRYMETRRKMEEYNNVLHKKRES